MAKMIRVSDKTSEYIGMLKDIKGVNTQAEVIDELLINEIKKTLVQISDGRFVPVGAVVSTDKGEPLVIDSIQGSFVVFTNGTSVINGGSVCRSLVKICNRVDEYDGGFINVR